jgi:O-antigen ligase
VFSVPDSRAARLVSASMDRLSTLGNSETFQGQDSSLNWRVIENEYAYSSIAEHPLIGLGMGVRYRPWDSRLDSRNPDGSVAIDGRSFIHNGHFRILLQSGLIGYLSLIWFSIVFLWRGLGNWQKIADKQMKAIVLGFSLVYLAILIAAVANSTFMQWRWIPLIGIMSGLNEVIFRWYCQLENPGTSNKNKVKIF